MVVRRTIAVTAPALNRIGTRGQEGHLQTADAVIPKLPGAAFMGLHGFIARGLPAGTSRVDPVP